MALLPTARLLPCLLILLTLTLELSSSAPSRNRTVSSSSRGRSGSKAGRTRGRTPAPGVVIAQRSPCSALVDGRLIDLTPLGDTHFTPSYSVEVGGWTYSFNPCFPFNVPENPYTGLEDQCDFVAMCQSKMTSEGHVTYTMGIQQTTSFVFYKPPGEQRPPVTSRPAEVTSQGDAVVWIDNGTENGVDSREDNSEDTIEDNEEGEEGEDGEENEEDDEEEEIEGEGEGELKGEGEQEENRKGGVVHKRGGGLDVSEEQEDEDTETGEGSGQDNDDEDDEDDDDDDDDSGDDDDDDDDSGDDDDDSGDDSGDDDDDDDEEDGQDENEDTTKTDVETSTAGQRRRQKLRGRETTRKGRYKRDIKEPSKKANKRRRGRKRKRPTPSVALSSVNSSLVQVDDRVTQGLSVELTTRRVSVARKGVEVLSTTQRPKYETVGKEKKGERSKKRRTSEKTSKAEKTLPVSRMPRGTPALKLSGIRSLRRQRTFVLLECDTKRLPGDRADFTFLRRQHRTLYFELRHVCCCPDACTTTVLRTSASRDQLSETEKEAGASFWPPHQLLWVVVAVFVIIFAAIVIGTACCRTGGAKGPYTMLPAIHIGKRLHSSRLTMSSMDSVRVPNKFPSPDYLDYTSPKLKQAQLPQVDNGIVLSNELEIGQRLGGGLFGDTYIGEFRDHNISAKRITVGVHKGQLTEVDRALLVDHISHFSTLQHKHIVAVIGICLETRQPHVIKEYVDGESLRMLLQHNTDGDLTYSRKLRMLTQAADGMTYLHSSKVSVLHRDLRCANLLISKVDDHVKITDFGMVRLLHRLRVQCTGREGCYCRKSTPSFPASIRWTAPEVLRHPASEETLSEVFGPPCDVFSFGMTIWEAVNASDPWYEMPREEDVMDAVLRGGRPEETLNEGTPDVHVGLMKACWLEDPSKRPNFKQIHSHLSSLVKQVAKGERRHQRRDSESSTMTYFRSALNISTQ